MLQRLGFYKKRWLAQIDNQQAPRMWIHGASAGDILAILPTVNAIKKRLPNIHVIATTTTNSGYAMLQHEKKLFAGIAYFPYDLPGSVARALKYIKPHVLVLEYTELWPNLIRAAYHRQIPVVLQNGRLADKYLKRYRLLFQFTGNLLSYLSLLLMRDAQEAQRARILGADKKNIYVTGNTKFDSLAPGPSSQKIDMLKQLFGFNDTTPVWVAGSTHEGEEDIVLNTFVNLRKQHPTLCLIIAPRYIERCDKIIAQVHKRGLKVQQRTQMIMGQTTSMADVFILNSIGELAACYALATLVFVGGSFVTRGGQNILEPAACGKPVIFGPYMHNFADSVQVLLGRGGIQVASAQQLQRVLHDLLIDTNHRLDLGSIAQKQVLAVRGAAEHNASLICNLLNNFK